MIFGDKLSPDPYDHLNARETMGNRHGHQTGDPTKGAAAMYKLAIMADPPLRVVIGSDAYKAMLTKVQTCERHPHFAGGWRERLMGYPRARRRLGADRAV